MKILLVNGSPHKTGCVNEALNEIEATFKKLDVEVERLWIGVNPVHGCIACGNCRKNGNKCIFNDDIANSIIDKMYECDGMIVGSPVYYAGPNGTLQAILDRAFYALNKKKCTIKAGASIVSCRRGGASASFDRLNKYFTISQIPVVSSSYWNSVHGNTPEEVRQDLEGLRTMRTLAKNMYHLIASYEKADIERINDEEQVYTNFIR